MVLFGTKQPADYQWLARDSALCLESYRIALQQGKEWTDDDGVSSVRGLEEHIRPTLKSTIETRAAHRTAVLRAQDKLKLRRDCLDEDAISEALKKMSFNSSRDSVQQALLSAREDGLQSASLLTRLRMGPYKR